MKAKAEGFLAPLGMTAFGVGQKPGAIMKHGETLTTLQ
jgi:hypothetical protein